MRPVPGVGRVLAGLGEGAEGRSRLFVFAEMLPRLRGLRCFVFVERAGTIRRRLVGIARAEKVRWALASQFPWLEQALMHEYGQPQPYMSQSQISVNGAVPPGLLSRSGGPSLRRYRDPPLQRRPQTQPPRTHPFSRSGEPFLMRYRDPPLQRQPQTQPPRVRPAMDGLMCQAMLCRSTDSGLTVVPSRDSSGPICSKMRG